MLNCAKCVIFYRALAFSKSSECFITYRRFIHTIVPLRKNINDDGQKGRSSFDSKNFKLNLDEIEKKLHSEESVKEAENAIRRMKKRRSTREVFTTPFAILVVIFSIVVFMVLSLMREKKLRELESERKETIGKAHIGGDWELMDTNGKLGGSEELKNNWLLLYFGFTNCPDICPDSIEKMVEVVEILETDKEKIHVIPVFISVDPERDTVERVKEYCEEFSPKIRGYTGTPEQVEKVAKTFRVYYSQGPRTSSNDYIVDHTVIMYLIDPSGEFHDYYGQNRTAQEIAKVIKMKVFKRQLLEMDKKNWFSVFRPSS